MQKANTNCPDNKLIDNYKECEEAIKALDLLGCAYNKEGEVPSHAPCVTKKNGWWTRNSHNLPAGCTWTNANNHDAHYNSYKDKDGGGGNPRKNFHPIIFNQAREKALKVSNNFKMLNKNTNCPLEKLIKTEEECKEAIKNLGLKDNSWWNNNPHDKIPAGCTWRDFKRHNAHWNGWTDGPGAPRKDLHPICKK
jgi:hypothetical protein